MFKTLLWFAVLISLRAEVLLAEVPATQPAAGCSPLDWKLVWSDEFNYSGHPDPAKWTCEVGRIRNHEAQFYTQNRLENARVENGELVIEGRKEEWKKPITEPGPAGGDNSPGVAHYTSASITTLNRASWRYGRIEAEAKLPQALGVWPAIWTLGTDRAKVGWPHCGEDDIMEFVGHDPGRIHGTAHYVKDNEPGNKIQHSSGVIKTAAALSQFHIYAVEWFPDHVDWYFDNVRYHHFDVNRAGQIDNSFRKPHYLILNLALGGDWGGKIDDAAFPQKYEVKYVRVFQTPEMMAANKKALESKATQP